MLEEMDRQAVVALNSFLGSHAGFDKAIELLGQNGLIRGLPVFFPLVALWFYKNDLKTRARLVAGLVACLYHLDPATPIFCPHASYPGRNAAPLDL